MADSCGIVSSLTTATGESKMLIHTIPQKESNTGSIHDIASQHFDRDIKFPGGCLYAVVCASYYGGRGYTAHKTVAATIKASNAAGDYSHSIIDAHGAFYAIECDYLVRLEAE